MSDDMPTIATLTVVSLLAAIPQKPPAVEGVRSSLGSSGMTGFVDFSADLDRVTVKLGLGELGKFRDGKRTRIKDADAHVGTGSSVSRVSGTQYYRVKSRTTLDLDTVLSGAAGKTKLPLEFDVQLAKMPGGELRRQVLSKQQGQIEVTEGMYGLWILETDPKQKTLHRVVHVIPQPKDMKRARFIEDVHDMLAINRRLNELKAAHEGASRRRGKGEPMDEIRKTLDAVLAREKVTLRNPENDRWTSGVLGPWKRRLREF